jgi:glycine/D-amino acid oxidase-like deaminating enzyme
METLARWGADAVTPMERHRVLDPRVDPALIEETRRRAVRLLPGLAGVPVTAAWAGYIDSTPDGIPAIGAAPGLPGLVLAAGFSGHGFGIGPGAGELVADLVTGRTPAVDPAPYRPARLARSAWGTVAEL